MYQGAWVYPGLKPGYHSSVMNSSTGMTVAIASPSAGWAPLVENGLSRTCHCRFALATSAFRTEERARCQCQPRYGPLEGAGNARPAECARGGPYGDRSTRGGSGSPSPSPLPSPSALLSPLPSPETAGRRGPGRLIRDGHQFHRPSSTTVDGTSRVRTRNVSIS